MKETFSYKESRLRYGAPFPRSGEKITKVILINLLKKSSKSDQN